jgi:hypothetical protein
MAYLKVWREKQNVNQEFYTHQKLSFKNEREIKTFLG